MCTCVCVRVCNPIRQIEATNKGEMLLSDLQHASFSTSVLSRLCQFVIHVSIWLLWSFSSSPNYTFIFSPVIMHQCFYLSITLSQSVINWFVLRKVFLHIQCWLLSVYLSSSVYVTLIDGVCVFLCVCVRHHWSHIADFWLQDVRRSGLLGPNQWLQSLTVYSFTTLRHRHTHINTRLMADKSKLSIQTLNKERRTGNDRSPLPNLQTLGTILNIETGVGGRHWLPYWDQRFNKAHVQTSIIK